MIENWARPAEQVLLAAAESKARTIGIIGPEARSGVSAFAHCLAEASALSGTKTLLVDLSQPVLTHARGGWSIEDGTSQIIKTLPEKYSVLDVRPTVETRAGFNNRAALETLLNEELKAYDQIILDLPALLHKKQDFVNPQAAARACDLVMLLCVPGRLMQGNLNSAMVALEASGAKLGGVILNDEHNPTLGEQIAVSAGRLSRFSNRLSSWVQRKSRSIDLLNMRG